MMLQFINVPTAPKSMMVMKLTKNCFFFTWNLEEICNNITYVYIGLSKRTTTKSGKRKKTPHKESRKS